MLFVIGLNVGLSEKRISWEEKKPLSIPQWGTSFQAFSSCIFNIILVAPQWLIKYWILMMAAFPGTLGEYTDWKKGTSYPLQLYFKNGNKSILFSFQIFEDFYFQRSFCCWCLTVVKECTMYFVWPKSFRMCRDLFYGPECGLSGKCYMYTWKNKCVF